MSLDVLRHCCALAAVVWSASATPAWASAVPAAGFIDLATKAPARQRTTARVLYDDNAVYVAFEGEQSGSLTAAQTTDDVGFATDDFVGFGIDVAGNGERVYFFFVTPRGTKYEQASESARYRPIWSAAAAPTARGWNAVMRIPYSALRLRGNGAQRWKLNFIRNIGANAEHDTWAFSSLMAYQPLPNWPDLVREWRYWPSATGVSLSGAVPRPQPRAEFYGLESTGSDRDRYTLPNGTLVERAPRTAGIDIALPIDPSVGLVGAFSPDFSNVEVDQQTIAPQQFQRNLTEYRPFFAQGAPFVSPKGEAVEFNLPTDTLFYSPAIGPFDRGLKLVGNKGTNAFGLLEVRGSDAVTGQPFDDVAYGFRHRRPNNTLAYWFDGVMANHGLGNDRTWEVGAYGRSLASGLVYAFDHAEETGAAVTIPSHAQRDEAFVDLQKPGMEVAVGWLDIGPQYAPLDGFTNIADVRGPNAFADLTHSFARGPVKQTELFLNADRWLDRQGNVHDEDADAFLTVRFRSPFAFYSNVQTGTLRTYGGNYYSGEPNGYLDGIALPYKTASVGTGYGEGTPSSIRIDEQAGPFGTFFLNQLTTTVIHTVGRAGLEFDYGGTVERADGAAIDGQTLRRLTLSLPLGVSGAFSVQYRDISGRGGNAIPGKNVAASFRHRFANGSELFVKLRHTQRHDVARPADREVPLSDQRGSLVPARNLSRTMADLLRFADFVFNCGDRILERDGARVSLTPKGRRDARTAARRPRDAAHQGSVARYALADRLRRGR